MIGFHFSKVKIILLLLFGLFHILLLRLVEKYYTRTLVVNVKN